MRSKFEKDSRNTGQAYISQPKTKKAFPARHVGPRRKDKCIEEIGENIRQILFQKYCDFGSLTGQRDYIKKCTAVFKSMCRRKF